MIAGIPWCVMGLFDVMWGDRLDKVTPEVIGFVI